ncbi:MAG: SpoIIE family protein phosphatase [Clostridia bacterium]|nr:SpoIIE family protein phosphatase [Clostridia bacterium]
MHKWLQKLPEKANDAGYFLAPFVLGLLSGIFCVGDISPFACAVVAAFFQIGQGGYAAFAGALCGNLICASYGSLLPLCICFILNFIWNLWQGKKIRMFDRILILVISMLCMIFVHNGSFEECMEVPLYALAAVGAVLILYNGICVFRVLMRKKRLPTEESLFSFSLLLAMVVLFLSPAVTEYFSLSVVAAAVAVQISACMSGINGMCMALIMSLGACYGANGFSVTLLGVMSLSCVLCYLVKKTGRVAVAGTFLAVSAVVGVVISHCMKPLDCLMGAIIFLCVPARALSFCDACISVNMHMLSDNRMRRRIRDLARVTDGVSGAIAKYPRQNDGQFAIRHLGAVSDILDAMTDEKSTPPVISVEVGMACIPKNGCAHTGDSVEAVDLNTRHVTAVSDGMGSGILAHNESRAAIECFMENIRAGFNTYDSVACANRRLISCGSAELYATLDAVIIDRRTSLATAVKLGAPPSFLVRDGSVHDICGESLPLGILDEVVPTVKKMPTQDGDMFVILTDGVTDALGTGLVAAISEHVTADKTPNEIANEILDLASYDGAPDDMSVVCVRVRSMTKSTKRTYRSEKK